jgi:hypothetical protein
MLCPQDKARLRSARNARNLPDTSYHTKNNGCVLCCPTNILGPLGFSLQLKHVCRQPLKRVDLNAFVVQEAWARSGKSRASTDQPKTQSK